MRRANISSLRRIMYIVFINISTASDSLAVLFYCISPSCYAGGFRYTIAAASDKPAPCFSPLIPALDFSQKLLTRTPLTPCLTYFIMPTIIFLRIICQVIGGACGGILVPCSDRWRMVMHPYRTLLPTVTG